MPFRGISLFKLDYLILEIKQKFKLKEEVRRLPQ